MPAYMEIISFPAKMRVLKPEVDKIGLKYPKKEDALKKQQEVMSLYKRAGVSNRSGDACQCCCSSLFLLQCSSSSHLLLSLRQESFLWAEDLSMYDSILQLPFNIPLYGLIHISLFTILMAAALFVTSKMSLCSNG